MSNRPIIKNYRSGRVGNDGNGMIGGSWWGCQHLGYVEVYVSDMIDDLEGDEFGDRIESVCAWLSENDHETVTIEAYINEGEDESTNAYEFDVDEVFYPDEFDEWINECPYLLEPEKEAIIKKFGDYVDNLDAHEFELYEPDYPDFD